MIDKDKEYKTRDGREVRIYATDGDMNDDPIHGATKENGNWVLRDWQRTGLWEECEGSRNDLIEVKPKKPKLLAYDSVISQRIVFYPDDSTFDLNPSDRRPEYDQEPNE